MRSTTARKKIGPLSRQIADLARRVHELTPSREADELAATLNEMVWQSFGLEEEISR